MIPSQVFETVQPVSTQTKGRKNIAPFAAVAK
jgi:hypothetical protein